MKVEKVIISGTFFKKSRNSFKKKNDDTKCKLDLIKQHHKLNAQANIQHCSTF